jgi:threonine dehydratase
MDAGANVRSRPEMPPDAAALAAVRESLAPTPLVAAPWLGDDAFLKLDSWQPTGSFKVRGAISALTTSAPGAKVVTASAGNHAMAVVWAAKRVGRACVVVLPENASSAKLAALERMGADVRRVGMLYDDAEWHAIELAQEDDTEFLSGYNDRALLAGHASLGEELGDDGEPLTIVCPVGSGGLFASLCLWASEKRNVRLAGVEVEASRAVSTAIRDGRVRQVAVRPTLADGLAGNIEPNSITWEIISRRADELHAISEDELEAAVRQLVVESGTVAEGAGAVATAALLAGRVEPRGRTVSLVTGRNIAPDRLGAILAN